MFQWYQNLCSHASIVRKQVCFNEKCNVFDAISWFVAYSKTEGRIGADIYP